MPGPVSRTSYRIASLTRFNVTVTRSPDRVVEQVEKHLLQPVFVTWDVGQARIGVERQVHVLRLGARRGLRQRIHVLVQVEPAEFHQRIQQMPDALGFRADQA